MEKDIKMTKEERKNYLGLVKDEIQKSFGESGIQVYEKAIKKLKTGENPSKREVEKLVSEIEPSLAILYGSSRSKPFCNELHQKLIECEKFSPIFMQLLSGSIKKDIKSSGPKIEEELYRFFEKGIPDESDITEIANILMQKGIKQDKNQLTATLKNLSIERVILDLNASIVDNQIKSFLDNLPTYTETDYKDFISYMKLNKINVIEEDIKERIEKERLCRKFGSINENEINPQEKIRQYINMISDNKKNYGYLKNNSSIQFAERIIEKK
ncbi:Uncharacterised protein [uncultured archaeon]|nr:Uncharacterised protein [uncultured archaeon]